MIPLHTIFADLRAAAIMRDIEFGDVPNLEQAVITLAESLGLPVGLVMSQQIPVADLLDQFG